MFSALVVTLREGVEAALIVGITLVYLAKIGRPELRRTVYAALVAAVLGSVAGAVALSYLPITEDAFEGWVMLVAAVLVVGMIVFMMRRRASSKARLKARSGLWPAGPNGDCLLLSSSWSSAKAWKPWSFSKAFP